MKFNAYKRGPSVKNALGETIHLIISRNTIVANTYKEALEKAKKIGFEWICHPLNA